MSKKVLIIIPTYNEAENIGLMLSTLKNIAQKDSDHKYEILVVDDNSPDGTHDIAKSFAKENQFVHLLRGKKDGLGAAYIRGFQWGLNKKHYYSFVMMDADFSHNPREIPVLLKAIDNGSDYVIGSRYVHGGHIPGDWPMMRILNSKIANFIAHFLIGIEKDITDITGGFKAIRVSAMREINLGSINAKGYFFQVNLVHEFINAGYKISERPISFTDREFGVSKLRTKDIFEFVYRAYTLNPDSPVRRFVRFGIVGLSGTVVNLAALTLLIDYFRMSALTSDIFAIEVSIISNFFLNHMYTFRRKGQDDRATVAKKLGQFNLSAASGAVIQFTLFYLMLKVVGVQFIISDLLAIAVSLSWNYWISTKLVWRPVHADS